MTTELRPSAARPTIDASSVGQQMYEQIAELYPICRSITGDGVRRTLDLIGSKVSLQIHEVPTGTQVFDWKVPREWNIRDAWVKNGRGERVVDFQRSNLHVVGYSVPVRARISVEDLKQHLHTLPAQPDLIPYRTSYYAERWGFCVPHRQLEELTEPYYDVCIDSTLSDGSLTYGECYMPGERQDEVLISCHVCHPSLCNDNLSGVALATVLAKSLASRRRRYSYRFLFIPVTIGSITWLAMNEQRARDIKHGLVLACVGDQGCLTYKKSRRGNAEIDRAVLQVLEHAGAGYGMREFSPYGYDERQFCSPGFDLPVGMLSRTPHGEFPEYHTSADNLDLVRPAALEDSFQKCSAILDVLEDNVTYRNLNPKCEPQLGRRGVYRAIGGQSDIPTSELALLWVLNLSDGQHTLLDIAERSRMPFAEIRAAAGVLAGSGLLAPCD
jgi:aminopeptidase-like protein